MAFLLGRTSAGADTDFSGAGNTACWPFTTVTPGELKYIFAQTKVTNTAGAVRFGIYDDNAIDGVPNALLGVASVDVLADANGTGVARATLASTVTIEASTVYWLGWFASTDNRNFQGTGGGSYEEDAGANFADPFVTSGTSTVDAIIWGESEDAVVTTRLLATTGVGT